MGSENPQSCYTRTHPALGIQNLTRAFELDPHNTITTFEAMSMSLDLGDLASARRWLQITECNGEEGSLADLANYTFAYYRGDKKTSRSLSIRLIEPMERVESSGIFLS